MSQESKKLILELAKSLKALTFGDFTLSSGQKSKYYFDGRLLTLDPEGAYMVAKAFISILESYSACNSTINNIHEVLWDQIHRSDNFYTIWPRTRNLVVWHQ